MLFEKMPVLPDDLAAMDEKQLNTLCEEIRKRLVETVSVNGGHLASNLGVVELTVALYSIYNPHRDRIIWDVGHQSYVHKILTGRDAGMDRLRRPDGVAGFPKISESDADAFNTGHSSTSISAALGYARAYKFTGENRAVIAVIGDGALTGGMAYEALNDIAQSQCRVIVVLNDNGMSIDRNVGGLSKYLAKIRRRHSYMRAKRNVRGFLLKIPKIGRPITRVISRAKNRVKHWVVEGKFFENLGLYYLGPVDGHDIYALKMIFERANEIDGPVLVHVQTQKGRGYGPAEKEPEIFHGVGEFVAETGEIKSKNCESLSKVFSEELCSLAEKDDKIVAVTAAMSIGTGLDSFAQQFPDRTVDVGIAEQHAITMAAGMSIAGMKPVAAIYSTFLQRAYDQLLHDVALQKHPLVVGIDRAGVCGYDGETHHGIYDFAYLGGIPFTTVAAPSSAKQLRETVRLAIHVYDKDDESSPVPADAGKLFAIRYPAKERATFTGDANYIDVSLEYGKGAVCFNRPDENGSYDVALLSIGEVLEEVFAAAKALAERGLSVVVFDARFFKPLDTEAIFKLADRSKLVVTAEDAIADDGFGEHVRLALADSGRKNTVVSLAHNNGLIPNDSIANQMKADGLDREGIVSSCLNALNALNAMNQ